jgi:hypothetical protein
MNTVERFELALAEAERRGIQVRLEPLQGAVGGLCQLGRKQVLFIDLTLPVADQLLQLIAALKTTASVTALPEIALHDAA